MKKIKSIYMIFVVFLIMIIAGFLLLYGYSRISLESLLMETALVQLEHSDSLLDQKVKEIEIEADGILSSDDLRTLHGVINARWDAYNYVTSVNAMKEYLESRQKSNVGMGEFILYWPKKERLVSTLNSSQFDREIFEEITWDRVRGSLRSAWTTARVMRLTSFSGPRMTTEEGLAETEPKI